MKRDNSSFGNYPRNLEFLMENKLINKKDKVLEIGSGKGRLLNTLLKQNYDIRGIDASEEFLQEGKKIYGEDLPIKRVSDEKLPYGDESFDKVLSFDVLEHIPDTDSHLQEVKRVLKDKGEYCFGIPNRLINEPFSIITYKNFDYKKPGDHCSLHTYWQIRRRLKKNGFTCTFFNINQNSDWIRSKVGYHFGKLGLKIFDFINIDRLPIWLKPTLYIVARKE
jgi:SAM-dependent methyltransferase